MANHLKGVELREQLARESPELVDSLVYTRKHRRKDAGFTFCVIRKSKKEEFLETMNTLGLETLKDNPTVDRGGLRKGCKIMKQAKLCSLNINHLYGKKEDLEILLKVDRKSVV